MRSRSEVQVDINFEETLFKCGGTPVKHSQIVLSFFLSNVNLNKALRYVGFISQAYNCKSDHVTIFWLMRCNQKCGINPKRKGTCSSSLFLHAS